MPPERTSSFAAANDSKNVSVVPQFVSILNGKGLEPFAEAGKNCISPNPPFYHRLALVGRHLSHRQDLAMAGGCYGGPPPCYGGRGEIKQSPAESKDK